MTGPSIESLMQKCILRDIGKWLNRAIPWRTLFLAYNSSRNFSSVIPACLRICFIKPRFTSPLCTGTVVRVLLTGCFNVTWLPRDSCSTKPARLSARMSLAASNCGNRVTPFWALAPSPEWQSPSLLASRLETAPRRVKDSTDDTPSPLAPSW